MLRKDVNSFPRITKESRGHSPKFWIIDGSKKLVKYNTNPYEDGDVMEMLASEILDVLNIKHVNVELGYDSNKKRLEQIDAINQNCAMVESYMTEEGDVSFELINNIPISTSSTNEKQIRNNLFKIHKLFQDLPGNTTLNDAQMFKDYLKIVLGDCVLDNIDRKISNIGVIYNEKQRQYRLAPSFDNALSFHSCIDDENPSLVCIGKQYYPAVEVIKFIKEHYSESAESILEHISELEKCKDDILDKYSKEIKPKKLILINKRLNNAIKELK